MIFKLYEFVDLPDIESRMSMEQRSYYVVNQLTLTGTSDCALPSCQPLQSDGVALHASSLSAATIFGSVVGTLLCSFVIFIVQVGIEGARMRHEARASKSRRLRYKANNEEVQAPKLAHSTPEARLFHIFLSHVSDNIFLSHSIRYSSGRMISFSSGMGYRSGPNAHRQAAPCGDDPRLGRLP